jgi:hypothetical protein
MTTITLPTTDGGSVSFEVSAVSYTAPTPVPAPPPAPTPPPPAPPSVRKALVQWHKPNQSLGSPSDTTTLWADHTHMRTGIAFSAVQVLFANPWSTPRTIVNHMVGTGSSGGLLAANWHAGASGLVLPAGQGPSTAQRNGYALGSVIACSPVAASDGGPAHLMLRADLLGCVWHSSPDDWAQPVWDSAYPREPMHSWVRYGSHAATPALAASVGANGWIDKPGTRSVGGIILHHNTPAAAVLYVGDSTTDADLITSGVCNYQSPGWRAVNAMAQRGVPITYGRLSQGGAKWDDIQYQLQAAIDAGACGAGVIAAIPTFTSNEALTAAGHWARSQALVTLAQNAGATVMLIGPMCSTSFSQIRHDVRALMLASGKPFVDTMLSIGSTTDLSVFAPGMCGDPNGAAVHPSALANATLAQVHDNKLTAIIG